MILEQKIAEAKVKRHKRFISAVIGFAVISLICGAVIFLTSCCQFIPDETEAVFPELDKETEKNIAAISSEQPPAMADEQLRQSYINALNDYENNIKPELNKIDLIKWDKSRSEHLATLQEQALSKFSSANYTGALSDIEELKQLAQIMITDSQEQYGEALSNAQNAYNTDSYDDAKFHIANALMLNKDSVEAAVLSSKIDVLPEILPLLGRTSTARIENNHEKELGFIEELVQLAPERESAVERKRELVNLINKKNFKSHIALSYQAIEQGNVARAKQKLNAAKNIFPARQEIAEVTTALKKLEKEQRLDNYQQAAHTAMAKDDWQTAKQQLQLALRERADDKVLQKSLSKTTTIINLKDEFELYIANPYRLSSKQLMTTVNEKISKARALSDVSPSLAKKAEALSRLVVRMSKKISVEVVSDNLTNVLVRGVGIVGVTQSKTIQLTPGHYKFEGKREGFKSKLIDVLIPYDKPDYRLSIICDEPI